MFIEMKCSGNAKLALCANVDISRGIDSAKAFHASKAKTFSSLGSKIWPHAYRQSVVR